MKRATASWIFVLFCTSAPCAQQTDPKEGAPPGQPSTASRTPAVRITLDQAIQFALRHNHALLAARSTILQGQASEITANLRPNPTLSWDSQFLPFFNFKQLNGTYFSNNAQFDIGVDYTFERGKKRPRRLQAAQDQTAVTRSQVADNERMLSFNVAQQFVAVLLAQSTLELANENLSSFQQTVGLSEVRTKAGDMSEGDLIKIKLQMLQFQTDVSAAKLAKLQALAMLRQLIGFESVSENYDVEGKLDYQPIHGGIDDLKALAMRSRPDLLAAQRGVTAARSQEALAEANGKRDLNAGLFYSHVGGFNTMTLFFNIQLPIFDRNQGEIERTKYAITQSRELFSEASEQVTSDVVNAYEGVHTNDQIVSLYQSGYLDQTTQSRDISLYAYQHGAASLLDYLDAERSYRSNQLAYRQALSNYMLAVEQVRQAVGTRNLP
jgi:cobalt-zinc-cadmium efflux system outer membrane protein